MDSRLEKLMDAFQSNGWTLIGSVDKSCDWWFENIFHFRSKWRPVDTDLFLTMLTDPQILDRKIVWCIGISSKLPNDRNFRYIDQITLNDIKRTDLKKFVEKVNAIVLS